MSEPTRQSSPDMVKAPNSLRAAQIIVGVITLGLAAVVLAFPVFAVFLIAAWLSLSLLFGGIEAIIVGAGATSMSKGPRAIRIAVGAIAIVLAMAVFAFPGAAVMTSVILLAIALLILGAGSIASGLSERRMPGWARAMLVVVGAITIGLSIPVWLFPVFGTTVLFTFIAAALIVNGVSFIVAGATGAMFGLPVRPKDMAGKRSWESDAA